MPIPTKIYNIFKIIVAISFLFPTITAQAIGDLKLISSSSNGYQSMINFYTGKTDSSGFVIVPQYVCLNDTLIKLRVYSFDSYPNIPQIESVYYGSLTNPKPGLFRLKYTDTENCKESKSKEYLLDVKKYHRYEFNLVENSSNGLDLFLKSDIYDGDVTISITDQRVPYDGFTNQSIGSCVNNILVSTLSQSSKMAFLTTTGDPGFPKVEVGPNKISAYDGNKCTDISASINIEAGTSYYLEIPATNTQTSQILQSSTSLNQSTGINDIGRGTSTIRTGGNSNYYIAHLPIVLITLIQLFLPNPIK